MLGSTPSASDLENDDANLKPAQVSSPRTLDLFPNTEGLRMNNSFSHSMLEATRLTRAGRLTEATAFLQRVLRGEPDPDTSDAAVNIADPPVGRVPPIIDIVPNTVELTDSPPSSRFVQTFETGTPRSDAGAQATASTNMPEALRGFLRRLNRAGTAPRLGGLAEPAPMQAPGLVPDGGRFEAKAYSNQAGSRTYKLYIPSGYRGQALPLIVMLHGCTQSPDDFAAGTRMNVLAEADTCFVAYPAQAASANVSKCWNWFSPGDQQRDQGEPSLIAGITRQVMRDHAVDPRRVYVAGLSAGAAAAAVLGTTYPDLYAAIGVHSGLPCGAASDLPSAFAAMRQGSTPPSDQVGVSGRAGSLRIVPTIVFHGDRDATVHPRNGDRVIAQLRVTTANLRTSVERGHVPGGLTYSRTLYTDGGGPPILEQWVVHGGGHAWSGGSPAGSHTDPRGPDAAREMLRFFLEHQHPSAARGV
jgi:poly(hydroxyalkanoate) depolymerase family esterase